MNDKQIHVRDFFIRFFNNIQRTSQVPANEIATKLLKLPMCYSSHEFTSLNLYKVEAALNKYNSLEDTTDMIDLIQMELNYQKSGVKQHSLYLDYICRHESLNNVCWYDFVSFLERTTNVEEAHFPFVLAHPLVNIAAMKIRNKSVIPNVYGNLPRFPGENAPSIERKTYEDSICLLFQPYRHF